MVKQDNSLRLHVQRSMQMIRTSMLFAVAAMVTISATSGSVAAAADQKALVARVEQLVGQITRSKSGDIIAVDLDDRAGTDNDLKLLSAAPKLQSLKLWGIGISDAGVDHLLSLSNLEDLELVNTRITDATLAKLVVLKKLKTLNLQRDTGITNDGMAH